MPKTTILCQVEVEDGTCDGEIEVEWEQHQGASIKTGRRYCQYCEVYEDLVKDTKCDDFEGDSPEHNFVDEWEEGPYELELVAYTTWCWHPITKAKARDQLLDEWQAEAEAREERRLEQR